MTKQGGEFMADSRASGVSAIKSHDELATERPLMAEAMYEKRQGRAIEDSINEMKEDIRDVINHRFTDFLWHTGALIAFGMFVIALYFWVDDKVSAIATASTRMEAKLEDLL